MKKILKVWTNHLLPVNAPPGNLKQRNNWIDYKKVSCSISFNVKSWGEGEGGGRRKHGTGKLFTST